MIQTVNFNDFRNAFIAHGRENQFSYSALNALFDYCEEWDDGKWELDVIALCCDFVEMSVDEVITAYNIEFDIETDIENDEASKRQTVSDYLEHNTILVAKTDNNSYLFSQF